MTQEIHDILAEIGYSLHDNGQSWRARPIYRESGNNTSLCIRKSNGSWIDFSVNIGGKFEDLVKLSLNLSTIDEAKKWLSSRTDISKLVAEEKPKIKQTKVFPDEILKSLLPIHDYWEKRNISKKTVSDFCGGMCLKGQMANRHVFPIFNSKKKIIGFVGRDVYNNTGRPKYKIIGEKSSFVWPAFINLDFLKKDGFVILVESPACVLRCWDEGIKNVICLFGTKISRKIKLFLIRMNFNKIIISTNNEPDNDNIGNNAAIEIKKDLCAFFDEKQIKIILPFKKDIEEMDSEQIAEWYKKCKEAK